MSTAPGSLQRAVDAIRWGGVVVIPTDTVYGLACDPVDANAVERIYAIKRRPADLELTILASGIADIEALVDLTDTARRLAAVHWPGALSIVATAKLQGLAVPRRGTTLSTRIPRHQLLLELLERTGPLATTSANRHGEPPAATASEAAEMLGEEVAWVLDGGPAGGTPSTVVDCTVDPPTVLRQGAVRIAPEGGPVTR